MAPTPTSANVDNSNGLHSVYYKDFSYTRFEEHDVAWPLHYRPLTKEAASKELFSLAKANSITLDPARGLRADSISFQPCLSYASEDRHAVRQLDVHGKLWSLTAIFDGHSGTATAEYAALKLPLAIENALRTVINPRQRGPLDPETVSSALVSTITAFDQRMTDDVLALFPGGLAGLGKLSDGQIKKIINDTNTGGANHAKVLRVGHGSTVLAALLDPDHEHLWVANLGDCEAMLVSETAAGVVSTDPLSRGHNGQNPAEIERQKREHPREDKCALNDRVLGLIAVFRALGDTGTKLPPAFFQRVLCALDPPALRSLAKWDLPMVRNRTPPYMSNVAEVTYRAVGALPGARNFLMMYSDGVAERYETDAALGEKVPECTRALLWGGNSRESGSDNLALRVLRKAMDAENVEKLSRLLTLEGNIPWMDDVTIIVQNL